MMIFKRAALGLLFSVCLLVLAICLSWHILSYYDFFFSSLYQQLDIYEHVQYYAPNNIYKQGFETTDSAMHITLFSGIVDAINNSGNGLNTLSYPYQGNEVSLFTEAEVIHLTDVANLINILNSAAWVSLFLLVLILIVGGQVKAVLPKPMEQLLGVAGVVIVIVIIAASIGFVPFFYFLHELIFPEGNQWFFYYEESLMSTLMKAPDLFFPMSLFLLALSTLVYCVLCGLVYFGYRKILPLR